MGCGAVGAVMIALCCGGLMLGPRIVFSKTFYSGDWPSAEFDLEHVGTLEWDRSDYLANFLCDGEPRGVPFSTNRGEFELGPGHHTIGVDTGRGGWIRIVVRE